MNFMKKIYDNVVKNESETIQIEKRVDELVYELIAPYENLLNDKEMDSLKDLLFTVALEAKQTGFEIGARFVIKLFCALLS